MKRWLCFERPWSKDIFSYSHLRCWWVFFLTYEFSKDLRLFLQLFVFRFIIERDRINIFEEISDQPLAFRKRAGSTFNIENNDPLAISISQMFLSDFHIQHCLNWWKLSNWYCFWQSAQALVRAARVEIGTFQWNQFICCFFYYIMGFVLCDSSHW